MTKFPKGMGVMAGQPTGFIEKIDDGRKVHTFRESATRWDRYLENQPFHAHIQIATNPRSKSFKVHFSRPYTGSQKVEIWRFGGHLDRLVI